MLRPLAAFTHLGYPAYLLRFIGTAKVLGVAAVLVPGLPRLREWAYAGLVFDLTGALYSHFSVGDPASTWIFAVFGLVLVTGSYLLQRAERKSGPVHVETAPDHPMDQTRDDPPSAVWSQGHRR